METITARLSAFRIALDLARPRGRKLLPYAVLPLLVLIEIGLAIHYFI